MREWSWRFRSYFVDLEAIALTGKAVAINMAVLINMAMLVGWLSGRYEQAFT